MPSKVPLLVLSLAVLSGAARTSASPVSGLLDELDIGEVARRACQSADAADQISRISTIVKLDNHLHDYSNGFCADVVHSLRQVVEANSNNVCSPETISAIEDFHRSYVENEVAPLVPRLFFLHYASEVSATCGKAMLANLGSAVGSHFTEDDYQAVESGAPAHASRRILFGSSERAGEQENLLLLSGLIERDPSEESVNPLTGEPVQFYVKERDISAANTLSEKCEQKFKPVYQTLVLPVIRLANLGYSDSYLQAAEQGDQLVKRWISITQVCEIVLSIRYIEDASLAADEMISISKIEAQQYLDGASQGSVESPLVIAPVESSLGDELESVQKTDAQSLLDTINSKVQAHDLAAGKALERLSNAVKLIPKNKVFVSLATDCQQDRCNYKLVDMKESQPEVSSTATEGSTGKGSQRSLKEFLKDEKEALGHVAYGVKWLGVVLYWIASGAGTG